MPSGRSCRATSITWRSGTSSWRTRRCGGDVGDGPEIGVTDEDVKLVLDNCRLDYVFEPDWDRLSGRACGLLSSAKTVAGWQDDDDGDEPQSYVLADPAARFVRDNVNVFLLGCSVERP